MFEPISNIIQKRANSFKFQKEILAIQIFQAWKKLIKEEVGKEAAKNLAPVSFRQGVLKVKVNSSVLAQEIESQKQKIIASLNRKTKKDIVKKIVFSFSR